MNVTDAIKHRFSCRAFLDKTVQKETIREIIDIAKHAPSSVNMQPWHVAVVSGQTKKALTAELISACEAGREKDNPIKSYLDEWYEPYKSRRINVGKAMYGALKIDKTDKVRQKAQWAKNYAAFDAPVMLLFFIDKLPEGALLDLGLFMQSLMLTAVDFDLATCAQFSLAEYPEIVYQHITDFADKTLVCGMAIGYPDNGAMVNQFRTTRETYKNFVKEYS